MMEIRQDRPGRQVSSEQSFLYKKEKTSWCVSTYFSKQACYSASGMEVTPKYKVGLAQIAAHYQSDADHPSILKWLLVPEVSCDWKSYTFSPKHLINSNFSVPMWTRRLWHFISCQKWIQLSIKAFRSNTFEQCDLVEGVSAYGRRVGARWSSRSLPTQAFLLFCDLFNILSKHYKIVYIISMRIYS